VLVVAPGDDFVLAERENRPDADLFADGIAILDLDMEDFGCAKMPKKISTMPSSVRLRGAR
jgi:hypothetical protein